MYYLRVGRGHMGKYLKSYLIRLVLASFVFILIVACGQPGELGLETAPVGLLSTADDHRVDQYIKTCGDLTASGKILVKSQRIRFDDTKTESGRDKVCEFGTKASPEYNGNLTKKDGRLRARYTQDRQIDLPANAVICDMKIESKEQDFRYDDAFFLSMNNYILASNHKKEIKEVIAPEVISHRRTNKNVSLFKYDWLKVRNTTFDNVANDFCLGNDEDLSSCQWPITEEYGKIKLEFDSELLIRLGSKSVDSKQALSFVVTGDNNPDLDCYHQELDLDLEIKYFIP